MHGYDFGGRPLPPPLANDLVPPYPPEPPYMDPGVAPNMDGYTLTSLDTSNESWDPSQTTWGHQSLLWYTYIIFPFPFREK